jgi:hypothetical protein
MTKEDLIYLKNWFSDYTNSYYSSHEEDQRNIMLKIKHSDNVRKNIVQIARASSLNSNKVRLAETIALFHDLGRFPQYAQYKTFRDADSVNHGLLGSRTLTEEGVLQHLPEDERHLIIQTVKFHNAFAIPSDLEGDAVMFLKLVRDADKVDIFRVFIEYYESPEEDRASATAFGVPDTPEYSNGMLSCIMNKQVASYSRIKTENDFKLMKLSWIYDMHFDESVRLLLRRNCVNKLIDKLPRTDEVRSAVAVLKGYLSRRIYDHA